MLSFILIFNLTQALQQSIIFSLNVHRNDLVAAVNKRIEKSVKLKKEEIRKLNVELHTAIIANDLLCIFYWYVRTLCMFQNIEKTLCFLLQEANSKRQKALKRKNFKNRSCQRKQKERGKGEERDREKERPKSGTNVCESKSNDTLKFIK